MNPPSDPITANLRRWQVAPPDDPGFRHQVWRRLGPATGQGWPAYLRAHAAAWSLAALLALGAAGFTGSTLARVHARADREAIVTTYLTDLDPRVQAGLRP